MITLDPWDKVKAWIYAAVAVCAAMAIGAAIGVPIGMALTEKHHADAQAKITAAATAQAARQARDDQKRMDAASLAIAVSTARKTALDQAATATLTKKVPTYVTRKADAGCVIPLGAVHVHDAAVAGVDDLPDAAPGADAAGSSVTLSQWTADDVYNLGVCHIAIDRLTGLQDWVRAQQQIAKGTGN